MGMNRRDVLQALAAAPAAALLPSAAYAQKASINYWHHFTIDHRVQGARAGDRAVQAEISGYFGAPGEHPEPGIHVEDDGGGCRQRQAGHLHGRRGARGRSRGDGRAYRPHGEDQGLAPLRGISGAGLGRCDRRRQDSTEFRPSPLSTGCTTARTGSTRKASRRPRPMPSSWMPRSRSPILRRTATGFSLRGGAGGFKFVHRPVSSLRGSPIVVDGKAAIDKKKAIEAVDFYVGLLTKHKVAPPSAPNDGYRQIMEAFKTGQTAMVWHHTGSLTEIQQALEAGANRHLADAGRDRRRISRG